MTYTHGIQSINRFKNLRPEFKTPEFIKQAEEYLSARDAAETLKETPDQSHWQSIAPKSEQDMPGYVEIAGG